MEYTVLLIIRSALRILTFRRVECCSMGTRIYNIFDSTFFQNLTAQAVARVHQPLT